MTAAIESQPSPVGSRASSAPEWFAGWPEAERAIHRAVRGRLPTGVEPADVSQQVAIRLLRAGDRTPPPDRLRFWCVVVARRVVADLYRKKALASEDLPAPPEADVESLALARMRCAAAAEAYAGLSRTDRSALADGGHEEALPNRTRQRRSRARRSLRQAAERLVGGGLLIPRWSWLAGTTGAAAVVVPLCLGIPGSAVDTAHDTEHGSPDRYAGSIVFPQAAPGRGAEAVDRRQPLAPGPAKAETGAAPAEPNYRRRVEIAVPGSGPATYEHYDEAPGSEPEPLACVSGLSVHEGACVDHPAK